MKHRWTLFLILQAVFFVLIIPACNHSQPKPEEVLEDESETETSIDGDALEEGGDWEDELDGVEAADVLEASELMDDASDEAEENASEQMEEDLVAGGRFHIATPQALALSGEMFAKAYWISDEGEKEDISASARWTSFTPEKLRISEDEAGRIRLEGLALGQAILRVQYGQNVSDPILIEIVRRAAIEARGIWVNRWAWSEPEDIEELIEKAAQANFNQIYFQVRGVFDAYYQSSLEPTAKKIAGELGGTMAFDPLQIAIDKAHEHGLELHAWVNVFTFWAGSSAPSISEIPHRYNTNPEWVVCDTSGRPMGLGGYIWASPGNPEVVSHNTAVIEELCANYDIDGLHLDRIRYPGRQYSHDGVSLARFELAKKDDEALTYSDWQRKQVNEQVRRIYETVAAVKPLIPVSAAVAGVYLDEWGWGRVTIGREDWYQDSRAWAAFGIIDALIPMMYWPLTQVEGERLDFATLVQSHVNHQAERYIFAGADLDKTGDQGGGAASSYESSAEMIRQIFTSREKGAMGYILYDSNAIEAADYWHEIETGAFTEKAFTPYYWWKQ